MLFVGKHILYICIFLADRLLHDALPTELLEHLHNLQNVNILTDISHWNQNVC